MTTGDIGERRRSREAALQMLYQWEVGRTSAHETIVTYWPASEIGEALSEGSREFANGLVRGTVARLEEIDRLLTLHAQNWRVERMSVLDRAILRMATYELLADPHTPAKVIINEAIELARGYSGDDAVGFVNGVLDAVRKTLNRTDV